MAFKSYRNRSRVDWGANQDEPLDREQISLGAQLRIADALERIADKLCCSTTERAARAIIRAERRLAKKIKLNGD